MGSINEMVAAYLARTGTTKAELAEHLGMSRVTLRSKLIGQSDWTLREAYELKVLLDVSADDMFVDVQAG